MSTANRVKQIVSRQGRAIAVALGIIALLAFVGAGLAYTSPTTTTVTEETAHQSFSTQVDTSAVVTGNTTLYDEGRRLENMPVYFLQASPVLNLTIRTSAPSGQPVEIDQELAVVFEGSREGEAFFTERRVLVHQSLQTADGSASAEATLNVSSLRGTVEKLRSEIGTVGSFTTTLHLSIRYRSDRYEGVLTAQNPIQISEGAYWLASPLSGSQDHSTSETRRVTQPPDPLSYLLPLGIGLMALFGAAAVLYGKRTFDAEAIEADLIRSQYDEWISRGEFPTSIDKKYTRISTLEDLVDIAIDSNKRVLYDQDLDGYAVVDGDLVYYYSPDPFDIDAWLDT